MSDQPNPLDSNIVAATLVAVYGVSGLAAEPLYVEWAADRALKTHSVEAVKTALARLNSARCRHGKIPAYPRLGSVLA